jgi:hypothetical protein
VLDSQGREGDSSGTRGVRLTCTLTKATSACRSSLFAPALSGLAARPRAATRMHSMYELAASRSCLVAAALGWRHGVGRLRRAVARPDGCPRRGSRTCRDSPRRCSGLSNTSDTRLGAAPSDKAGAENTGAKRHAIGEHVWGARRASQIAQKNIPVAEGAGTQVTHNWLLPDGGWGDRGVRRAFEPEVVCEPTDTRRALSHPRYAGRTCQYRSEPKTRVSRAGARAPQGRPSGRRLPPVFDPLTGASGAHECTRRRRGECRRCLTRGNGSGERAAPRIAIHSPSTRRRHLHRLRRRVNWKDHVSRRGAVLW